MIWLLWKLLTLPIRLALGSLKVVLGTVRFVGLSRIAAFGGGVAVGMAVAPVPGKELRANLAQTQQAVAATGGDLAAVVRYELSSSPRTWHLPQPAVRAEGDRIVLTGSVPHDDARLALVRTAGAVVGVRAVDDRLVVDGQATGPSTGPG